MAVQLRDELPVHVVQRVPVVQDLLAALLARRGCMARVVGGQGAVRGERLGHILEDVSGRKDEYFKLSRTD